MFYIGETVICSVEVKNKTNVLSDPATAMKITITDKSMVVKVDAVAMTQDSTGKYHYDCQTVGYDAGDYAVEFKAIDGTRITIEKETFNLV